MKRPSLQWYPGDSQRDTALRACSLEARGLWREMLDLMHDGEPYGHLTAGGVPISEVELARIIGCRVPVVRRSLKELEARRVFSRTETGVIYSRRMVRDEYNREVRGAGGVRSLRHPNVPRARATLMDQPKDTFEASLPGSPAVAVGSLHSAKRVGRLSAGSNGASVSLVEGGELVRRIRGLGQRLPNGRVVIARTNVEALGLDVLRAYEALGGSERFSSTEAKNIAFLVKDFRQALDEVRRGSAPPAEQVNPHAQ